MRIRYCLCGHPKDVHDSEGCCGDGDECRCPGFILSVYGSDNDD